MVYSFPVTVLIFYQYMERAEGLRKVRGDDLPGDRATPVLSPEIKERDPSTILQITEAEFDSLATERFSKSFRDSAPRNAQRLILLCLRRDPKARPTAEQLLGVSEP